MKRLHRNSNPVADIFQRRGQIQLVDQSHDATAATCRRGTRCGLALRTARGFAICAGFLLVSIANLGLLSAEDAPAPAEKDVGPGLVTVAAPLEPLDFRRQRVINQTLLREAEGELLLQRFAGHVAAREWVVAANLIHEVMQRQDDAFVWQEGTAQPLRQLAIREFEACRNVWAIYEQLYEPQARKLWDPQSRQRCCELTEQYYFTKTGHDAAVRLAAFAWDEGDFEQAARLWMELLRSPYHSPKLTIRQVEQARLIGQLIGETSLIEAIDRRRPRAENQHSRSEDEIVAQLRATRQASQSALFRSWTEPQPTVPAAVLKQLSPPLRSPKWSIPRDLFAAKSKQYPPGQASKLRSAVEMWSLQQHEHLTPELSPLYAVTAGNVLVFRDMNTVQAYDLQALNDSDSDFDSASPTKRRLWQFNSLCPLGQAIDLQHDPFTGVNTNHPAVDRLWLADSVSGTITADSHRIFFVDSVSRRPRQQEIRTVSLETDLSAQPEPTPTAEEYRLTNRLCALPVRPAVDSLGEADGSVVPAWQIDRRGWRPPQSLTQSSTQSFKPTATRGQEHSGLLHVHPLQGHYFLGPLVVAGDRGYVISEFESHFMLSALDPATGECVWTQAISYVDRALDQDVIRAVRACLPVCRDGLVICDNGNGQLVAVDGALGSLAWVYCYADDDARQESGRWTYTQTTRVSQPGALNLPIVIGDHVLLMPDRSVYVHCCDLKTGQLVWKQRRDDAEYLVGVESIDGHNLNSDNDSDRIETDLLLAVGARKCRALRAETGEQVWETQIGFVSGTGVQVGNLFLLPSSQTSSLSGQGSSTVAGNDTDSMSDSRSNADQQCSITRGQVVALDLATGKRFGYELSQAYAAGSNCASKSDKSTVDGDQFAFSLGNLLACNDMIISVGINQVIGFEQAGAVVERLAELDEERSLNEAQLQHFAEAELVLGQITAAKRHLQRAMRLPVTHAGQRTVSGKMYRELLYHELRQPAEALVTSDRLTILRELAELADSPQQQARYLLTEIELLLQNEDHQQLWNATEKFAQIGLHVPLPSVTQSGYTATSATWLPGLYAKLFRQLTPAEKQTWLAQVEANWLSQLEELTTSQLVTFREALCLDPDDMVASSDPQAVADLGSLQRREWELSVLRDVIQLELIGRALADGHTQQAELLLLELGNSDLPVGQVLAGRGLMSLYSRLGLYEQAGRQLQVLNRLKQSQADSLDDPMMNRLIKFLPAGNFRLDSLQTVSAERTWLNDPEFLIHFDQRHLSWRAYRHREESAESIRHISIQETHSTAGLAKDPYARRRPLYRMAHNGWIVMQQLDVSEKPMPMSAGNDSQDLLSDLSKNVANADAGEHQHLIVLEPRNGQVLSRLALPGTRIGISNAQPKHVGHLLPICVDGQLMGVSLLTGCPIWQRDAAEFDSVYAHTDLAWAKDADGVQRRIDQRWSEQNERPRRTELGPVGPGYCIVQTARALTCLNPIDGRLLWQRTDLNPQGGIWSDRAHGLIGDQHTLVYFQPDQNGYTLLNTKTGEIVRTGQLEPSPHIIQRTRRAFGRQLMYMTISQTQDRQRQLKLWDPLSEELKINEPFGSRDLYHTSEDELTWLTDGQRLQIYRPEEGRFAVQLDLQDDTLGRANYLRVMRQGDHYLVNLYQTRRVHGKHGYASRFTDAPWKLTHINGPLLAINATTNQLEWTRTFPNRSLVNDVAAGLPFLVMCANHQVRPGDQQRTMLVEAIDLKTGDTISMRDDLTPGRMLLLNHDRRAGEVRLSGLNRDVALGYAHEKVARLERLLAPEFLYADPGE